MLYLYFNGDDGGEYGIVRAADTAQALGAIAARFLDIYGPSVATVNLLVHEERAENGRAHGVLADTRRFTVTLCTCGRNMTTGEPHTADCEYEPDDG